MNWKVLKTEEDYNKAVSRVEVIFDAGSGTKHFDELELLGVLIKDYEDKYYPMSPPDPIEVIKLRMEELGMKNRDLIGIIGSESHVSSVLKGRRQLTLEMAKHLSQVLNIPARIFINEKTGFERYQLNPEPSLQEDGIEEILRKSKERILRLKEISMKLRKEHVIKDIGAVGDQPELIFIGKKNVAYVLAENVISVLEDKKH